MNPKLILFGAGAGLVLVVAAAWAAKRTLPAVGSAINPLNPNNVFAGAANAVTEAVTGDPSLGGLLCDLFPWSECARANAAIRAPVVLPGTEVDPGVGSDFFFGAP